MDEGAAAFVDLVVGAGASLNTDGISQAFRASSSRQCHLDLSKAYFVEPIGLVTIAAMAERAVADGRAVVFSAPARLECHRYLSRMQLGPCLDALGVEHDLMSVTAHDVGNRLSELRHFRGEAELDDIADVLLGLYGGDSATFDPVYTGLYELASNAEQHSGREGGFVALQRFAGPARVNVAIADSGVGLLGSLSKVQDVADDRAALSLAARKHETSLADQSRGLGITRVVELAGEVGGDVTMISGTAHGVFERGHWDPRFIPMTASYHGTVAQASLALRGE